MAGHVSRVHSIDDPLKDLWNNHIDFRDEFCQAMDVKYSKSGIRNWCHLAEKFKIQRCIYESFSDSENISPSEEMLEYLETIKPDLKVSDFVEACETAGSYDICSFFGKHIAAGKVGDTDKISTLWDKAHQVIDKLLLMLDRNHLWIDVAKALKIRKDKYQAFQSDPDSNHAHVLFEILTIEESQPLNVQDLKSKLEKIERGDVKKILDEEEGISDKSLLREIRGSLYKIEQKLNREESVYKLAQLYQKADCLKDRNIELLFRSEDSCGSPTERLIEHVIKAHPEDSQREPTVRDLIVHLLQINRDQELKLIERYLEDDIKTIKEAFQNNLRKAIPHQKVPSTQSEAVQETGERDDTNRNTEQIQNNLSVTPRQQLTQNVARVAPTRQQRQPSPENEDVISGNDDYTDLR